MTQMDKNQRNIIKHDFQKLQKYDFRCTKNACISWDSGGEEKEALGT